MSVGFLVSFSKFKVKLISFLSYVLERTYTVLSEQKLQHKGTPKKVLFYLIY